MKWPLVVSKEDFDLLLKLLELATFLGGGGAVLWKMGRMMGAFEVIGREQAKEISEMKSEIKSLTGLVTSVAVQKAELATVRADMSRVIGWYDELRHGKGLVVSNNHEG